MSQERRKSKRTDLTSSLVIKRLDDGSNHQVSIQIHDVSRTGLGFVCKEPLQIGEVYETFLTIWTKEVIHVFLKIVRIEITGNAYAYGSVFIGMPETDLARIEVYQTVNENQNGK